MLTVLCAGVVVGACSPQTDQIAQPVVSQRLEAPERAASFTIQTVYPPSQFTAGYCTHGAASIKGSVEWKGDAKDWYANAKAAKISVGSTPQLGAIVVFPGNTISPKGHVGVLNKKDANGKWWMKSMNDLDVNKDGTAVGEWSTRIALEYLNSKNRVAPTGYIYYKLEKY